ncbi:MAG: two component transcriptional regulator, winged helix family [Candidatus Eremiobacteraeota bacterium]|nr:two component transcriptional regulator, winged helix family [Candidatus Eremiobacteraeota bacterium]
MSAGPGPATAPGETHGLVTTTITTSPTVLLVDDEPALIDVLEQYLRDDGFAVLRAGDGPAAVALFKKHLPDLVLLDLNLPGVPGTEVLRQIRAVRDVPVIMLTARVHEVDRVVGLELGADDYVGKPFSPREVVARVKSVLRRTRRGESEAPPHEKRIGGITIDTLAHEVHVDGKLATLTPTQFKILDVLMSHVGQTLTRDQLLQRVNAEGDAFDRTLDRHIANLRARVEPDSANPRYIVTVFGVGYKMVEPS